MSGHINNCILVLKIVNTNPSIVKKYSSNHTYKGRNQLPTFYSQQKKV